MAPSAGQAFRDAVSGDGVIGWKLDRGQRAELLQQFPPRYPKVDADHVTLTDASAESALPDEDHGEIVGRVDDGRGVEAMVVRIAGTTDRPDGSTYHITWSLVEGRRAVESNDVLREASWEMFDLAMPVALQPSHWRSGG